MAQKQDGLVVFEVREHQVSTSVPHLASDHRNLCLSCLLSELKPFFLLQQSPATREIRSFNCREMSGEGSRAGSAVPEQPLSCGRCLWPWQGQDGIGMSFGSTQTILGICDCVEDENPS